MSNSIDPNNPYDLDHGYQDNHNYAISGYGITIDSINHFLYQRQLPNNEVNYTKLTQEPFEDAMDQDFSEFLDDRLPDNQIQYVSTSNAGISVLMMYAQIPSNFVKTIPKTNEIDQQLVQAIELLYAIPKKDHQALTQFVDQYADYIGICDYS